MVSFICNACGQTVRKAQVEKHYQNDCHGCDVLSCIDCGKDFHGDEYTAHTSCITEAEKYQGKLYKPKDKQNKGEHKQQEWLKQVRKTTKSGTVDPRLAGLLDRISEYSNIPRKKAKFQNFCKNSINVRDSATLDRLWEVFSSSSKQTSQQNEVNGNPPENGKNNVTSSPEVNLDDECENLEKTENNKKDKELVQESNKTESKKTKHSKKHKKKEKLKVSDMQENGQKSKAKKNEHNMNVNTEEVDGLVDDKKKRKRKRGKEDEEIDELGTQSKVLKVETEENKERYHFKWKSVIKAVLREAPDHELPMKRLRKKVLAEFQANGASEKNLTDNELRALFEKKVTSNPKFKVHKDRVKLLK